MHPIEEIFAPGGRLAAHLPGFRFREPQQRMALCVSEAIETHSHAVLEAGTGIGKTFAYVVPVLLSGRRAIVSTGTRTLQDQLFERDLPALGAALGRPVDVALLKGRSNYLCWHRLETARLAGQHAPETQGALDAIADWGGTSESGDLSELDDFAGRQTLSGLVTSTADNCLGSQCDHFDRCFVARARRQAQSARVVIVNHHLLLADLALRESGFAELLPDCDVVVVDEAHLLPDVAQQFFDTRVSTREIESVARDLTAEAQVASQPEIAASASGLLRAVRELRIRSRRLQGRLPWSAAPAELHRALAALAEPIERLAALLAAVEGAPALTRCRERLVALTARLATITGADEADGLRWLDFTETSLSAHLTPLDVGAELGARIAEQGGAWIMTSATLAVREDFSHFLGRVGISDATAAVLPSPFDYRANARIFLPDGLPEPGEPDHVESLLRTVWPLLEATGGGAFLLFTSYRALGVAQRWLADRTLPGPLLVQGEDSRSRLLERFRAAGDASLLGTGSFWQGVDVRGPALRLVVIDKLPFAAPNDPMVQARIEAIRREGGDAFGQFQLPQAALALKQGVGRLIRDFEDRGLVVLGDSRLRTRAYGRVFLDSLPPMPLLEDPEAALAFARSLVPEPVKRAQAGLFEQGAVRV